MANMNAIEAVEKIRLLNRGKDFKLVINPSNINSIYIEGEPSSLSLGDGALGDVFEWVDDTHKQIKPKGDSDLAISIKKMEEFPKTSTPVTVSGPNSAMMNKINELLSKMIIPAEAKEADKTYTDIDGGGHFIEATEENSAKYTALMGFYNAIEPKSVFDGATKDDVMEFRMKIKGKDGKQLFPIFVNKKDIHVILKFINILKTYSDEFELPNEFYQMILNGSTFEMKELAGTTDKVPEPKLASESINEYEDRLKAKLGDSEMDPVLGIRKPYKHEVTDYSQTVNASATISGDNPTLSGSKAETLTPSEGFVSGYYSHLAVSSKKNKGSLRYVDTGYDKPVRSEIDEPLTAKVKNTLKGFLAFLKEHKLAALIITGVVVGGTILVASGGLGPMLATLAKVVIYTLRAFVVPIPKILLGAPLTAEDALIALMEAILIIYGVVKLHKKRKAKKAKKQIPPEEEIPSLQQIIEENQQIIHDAEGVLISINATLNDPNASKEAKDKAKADYEKATRSIERANLMIKRAKARLVQISPLDMEEEDLGFTNPEAVPEGGLRF